MRARAKSSRVVIVAAALTMSGCGMFHHKPDPPIPAGADPRTTCPKDNACTKVANRRQYFDQHENRYYYFDVNTGRYYWENGQARFAEPGDKAP